MATPFDLYQAKQFEGLDPNKFNKDAYQEQQKSLFANTFKDQLTGLKGGYEKELGTSASSKAQAEATSKQLEELNGKTKGHLDKLKDAENGVNSTKNMVNSYSNKKDRSDRQKDQARKNYETHMRKYNEHKKEQGKYKKGYDNVQKQINNVNNQLSRFKPGSSQHKNLTNQINNLKNNKDYKAYNVQQNHMNNNANIKNKYATDIRKYDNISTEWSKKLKVENNTLIQRNQVLSQANNEMNNHKQQVAQTGQQLSKLNQTAGISNRAADKAMADAQGLQEKISKFQGRSEPLKALEGKVEGDYAASMKSSTEELKKVAANSLDPLSQKNAQNLLNQRAEQLSKTYGKNIEDVKKEMGTGAGQLGAEQFNTQEDFNKYMGIEAQKAAELQQQGALNNLDAQGKPTETSQAAPAEVAPPPTQAEAAPAPQGEQVAPVPPATPAPAAQPAAPVAAAPQPQAQPAAAQVPAPTPAAPPQPAAPVQPAPQQVQSAGSTGMPAPSAPQTGMPQAPKPLPNLASAGMPTPPQANPQAAPQAQPYGNLTGAIKQGISGQLQKGFQSAMKINATNKPIAPTQPRLSGAQQQSMDDTTKRRQAVAAQAMGIAAKPTSNIALRQDKAAQSNSYGMNQNVSMNQEKNTLTKGVGRRPAR